MPPEFTSMQDQINHVFSYHAPTPEKQIDFEVIRAHAKQLATAIVDRCPPSADRSAALRQLRECVMTANAAIALDGKAF